MVMVVGKKQPTVKPNIENITRATQSIYVKYIINCRNPTKKPEEHPADKKFTIEIGDTMTLKNFPAPGSDIDFNQPDSQLINFFNVDQDKGYAYIGDSMIWLLTKNDTIEINDTPSIQKIGNAPRSGEFFSRYNNTTKHLEIGPSITEIGRNAFFSNLLESVDFSNATSLTTIKQAAFSSCTSLTEITLPNSLRVIENKAFDSCTALNNLVLNDGLITIGPEAFTNCITLSTVTIPSTVTTIGRGAFSNDNALSSLTFDGTTPSIKTIESFAFCDKGGSITLTIPSSVEKLGLKCFNEFDPDNITLADELLNTKWSLRSSTGSEIQMFILGVEEQRNDFLKGITGATGFSKAGEFTDDTLGYFEIIQQTQPVR